MEKENIVKNNNKKGNGGLIFIIVLILAILTFGIYYFVSSKPENVFKTATNTLVGNAEKLLDSKEKNENLKTDVDFSVNIKADNDIANLINNLKLKVTNYTEIENQFSENKMVLLSGEEKLLDAILEIDNKNTKIACPDLFSKSINLSEKTLKNLGEQFGISLESNKGFDGDIKFVLERFKIIFNEQLDEQEYIRERADIKIENSTIKANKNTLEFTTKELIDFLQKFEKKLKEDDEFVKAIGNQKTFVFDEFDEFILNIKKFDESFGESIKFNFSIYTKGIKNEFLKFEFLIFDETSCYGIEAYKKADKDYIINMALSEESTNLFNAESMIKLEITEEMIKVEGDEISGTIKFTENSVDIEFKTSSLGIESEIKIIASIEKNVNYDKYDFSNVIQINELTAEDEKEIINNLQQSKIFSFISPLFEMYTSILGSANK